MNLILHRLYRAVLRVIPTCLTQSQAVAFNMFLASFPMLLVVLGGAATSGAVQQAFQTMVVRLRPVLPPGTVAIFNEFLLQHSSHPRRWLLFGLGGTLLAGIQMMKLMMEGFRMVHGDSKRLGFLSRHVRALLLLSATILPSLLTVNLIVFGKQLRGRMLHLSSMPVLIRFMWSTLYVATALLLAMSVVAVIYRVGRPKPQSWRSVIPGAAIATLLWWTVSAALGFYLRQVPYSVVYGGLAVAIGLMLWMQITVTILLIGAAYNAELQRSSS
jgi:membrane protein